MKFNRQEVSVSSSPEEIRDSLLANKLQALPQINCTHTPVFFRQEVPPGRTGFVFIPLHEKNPFEGL
jgi:hypothetical protein